jgi:hypothetical protein
MATPETRSFGRRLSHHEEHEAHEDLNKPSAWLFFVLFVSFVVNIGLRLGCAGLDGADFMAGLTVLTSGIYTNRLQKSSRFGRKTGVGGQLFFIFA